MPFVGGVAGGGESPRVRIEMPMADGDGRSTKHGLTIMAAADQLTVGDYNNK